jgi:hypothetical protein
MTADMAKLGSPANPLGITLDSYVKGIMEESKRKSIQSENIKTTKYNSGYIDLEGHFYGCGDIQHISFSEDLCEHFKIKQVISKKSFGGEEPDAQKTLDKLGWIKVSCRRFWWDKYVNKNMDERKITQAQKDAIWDYMEGHKMRTAEFEHQYGKQLTFKDAFEDYDK